MSNEKIRQDVLTYMESHATHPVSYDDLGRDLRYKGKGLGALWTEIEMPTSLTTQVSMVCIL